MKKLVILVISIFIEVISLFAQDLSTCEAKIKLGDISRDRCDYRSAIKWYTEAANYIKDNYGIYYPDYVYIIDGMAFCYSYLDDYSNAIKCQTEATAIYLKTLGKRNDNYICSLKSLASYYQYSEDFSAALEAYKKVIKLYEKSNPDRVIILWSIAECLYALKKYSESIKLYEKILAIIKKQEGRNNLRYKTALEKLALCYKANHEYDFAIRIFSEAISIRFLKGNRTSIEYNIESMSYVAECYAALGQYSKAITLQEKVVSAIEDRIGEAWHDCGYDDHANSLYCLYQYYQAIGDQVNAHTLLEKYNNAQFEAYIQNAVDAYYNVNYSDAIYWGEKTVEFAKVTFGESDVNYVIALNNLAVYYNTDGRYYQAINTLLTSCTIIDSLPDDNLKDSHIHALENLSFSYIHLGENGKAIDVLNRALTICEDCSSEEYLKIMSNLGTSYLIIGDYSNSIKIFNAIRGQFKDKFGDNHPDYLTLLNNIALAYSALGYDTTAYNIHKCVLEKRWEILGESHPDYAQTLLNMASLAIKCKSYDAALYLYQDVLKIYETTNSSSYEVANTIQGIADCYCNQGEIKKAIETYERAKSIFPSDYFAASINVKIADCCVVLKDYNQAIDLYTQTLNFIRDVYGNDHKLYINTLYDISNVYFETHQYNIIYQHWSELYKELKKYALRQMGNMTHINRFRFWYKYICPKLNSVCLMYSKILSNDKQAMELAYNSLLFSKGINLMMSRELLEIIKDSNDDKLLTLYQELQTINAVINHYHQQPIADRPNDELERLKSKLEELENNLINGSKEYDDFTKFLSIEWHDVMNLLKNNDVSLEFIVAPTEAFADSYCAVLVLRKGWDSPQFIELCDSEELEKYYSKGYVLYQDLNSTNLYNLIWSKLEPYINEGDNVFFAPDGLLYQMNIEVLQDAEGRRANEKWNLHRVSSTRELCMENPQIDISSAALYGGLIYDVTEDDMLAQSRAYGKEQGEVATRGFIADSTMRAGWKYLEGSKSEVETIAHMCRAQNISTDVYSTIAGNEESFKALSGKKTPIIHLATHGFFYKNEEVENKPFFETMHIGEQPIRPDNSLKRSGLILAGAQRAWLGEAIPDSVEDGILLAEEIATMDLTGTDLVVLSACETGLGEITSEGVFGLQRAFKKAGVQTIIMSLWKVDDTATSLFMQTFYEYWLGGKTKHEAFTLAQDVVRTDDRFSNPFYWAGFIMLD